MSDLEHAALFEDQLFDGEEILWTGRPDPSVNFDRRDLALVPFSIAWAGFAIFATAGFVKGYIEAAGSGGQEGSFLFLALAAMFSLLGLYLLVGRFFNKRWNKLRTYYALTNLRVLILETGTTSPLSGVPWDKVPAIGKTQGFVGTGTVTFAQVRWWKTDTGNTGLEFFTLLPSRKVTAFYDIAEVDRVYDLANELGHQRWRIP
ncbi:MAG: hypothetical protein IIC57_09355 [Proteobacteria bacterium]|nr:hypothetical protein [Pseudomonadota bacterium]